MYKKMFVQIGFEFSGSTQYNTCCVLSWVVCALIRFGGSLYRGGQNYGRQSDRDNPL